LLADRRDIVLVQNPSVQERDNGDVADVFDLIAGAVERA